MTSRVLVSAAFLVLSCGLAAGLVGCESSRLGTPGAIAGRYIITVGDADMAASTLATGELGERDPNAQDTLTVVGLPIKEPTTDYAQINVSNSALCPPTCLSVTRDGRYAFIVEYRGPAGDNARTVSDLAKGDSVTAVDLTDALRPVIAAKIQVPAEPIAVGAHPTGDIVAVVTHTPGKQLVLVPFKGGSFTGEPTAWAIDGGLAPAAAQTTETAADASSTPTTEAPAAAVVTDVAMPSSVVWHPSGKGLAVTVQNTGQVIFFSFRTTDDGRIELAPWGTPVKVGMAPYTGSFTPDGKHFIVNDLMWPQGGGYTAGTPQGKLVSIRVGYMPGDGETATDAGAADHVVVGESPVGINPVAMAISADGKLVVTANMQQSFLPDGVMNDADRGGSLSLVELDADGTLHPTGEYPLNAVPAGVSFDAKDRHICVTQFRSFDPGALDGELGFWSIHRKAGKPTTLQAADFFVGVGKGPHGVLIVR